MEFQFCESTNDQESPQENRKMEEFYIDLPPNWVRDIKKKPWDDVKISFLYDASRDYNLYKDQQMRDYELLNN